MVHTGHKIAEVQDLEIKMNLRLKMKQKKTMFRLTAPAEVL